MSKRLSKAHVRKAKSSTSTATAQGKEPTPTLEHVMKEASNRACLYFCIRSIHDLPKRSHDLVLRMEHPLQSFTNLTGTCRQTPSKDICLKEVKAGSEEPVFTLILNRDDMDHLSLCCDNPLLITLLEVVGDEVEQDKNERKTSTSVTCKNGNPELKSKKKPLYQGCIDMLQFFKSKRINITHSVELCPVRPGLDPEFDTSCKLVFEIYTLLPLLPTISYCNVLNVTLESVYNLPEHITDFVVDLSFQKIDTALAPKQPSLLHKVPLCSYRVFTQSKIRDQNVDLKWETLLKPEYSYNNSKGFGIRTGASLKLSNLFHELLCPDGVDFYLDELSKLDASASICNAVHRFCIDKETSKLLENLVVSNDFRLLMEIHAPESPDFMLYYGAVDLSIFLYPQVNSCRIATYLSSVSQASSACGLQTSSTFSDSSLLPCFAIVNISLTKPITETATPIVDHDFKPCDEVKRFGKCKSQQEKLEDIYADYDRCVEDLVGILLKRNITTMEEAYRECRCDDIANIQNKVADIIANDYNVRFPTKNNIDFQRLMAVVYNDLMQRNYKILMKQNEKLLTQPNFDSNAQKMIQHMNLVKFLYELNDLEIADKLNEKLKTKYGDNVKLEFYYFIYNIEKHDFVAAKEYTEKPRPTKDLQNEYFEHLACIYIDYMSCLKTESISPATTCERLLSAVCNFVERYPEDMDAWILLYCLYKRSLYTPGVTYARWNYENLYRRVLRHLPDMPISLWEMNLTYATNSRTKKLQYFSEVLQRFAKLGLYDFAQFIFKEIENNFAESDSYILSKTLKLLQKHQDVGKEPTEVFTIQCDEKRALLHQVNGNLELYKGSKAEALKHFTKLVYIYLPNQASVQLGLLRTGYLHLEMAHYKQAADVFEKLCTSYDSSLIANFNAGRAMYKYDYLAAAKQYFINCTSYQIHLPEIWGYLALLNLKMGRNFEALECWKYARIKRNYTVSEEVLQELRNIDYDSISLTVDAPNPLLSNCSGKGLQQNF